MKMKKLCIPLALLLFLLPAVTGAMDYKAWLPLLPRTLGGMSPSGEPDGMNMEMGGQKWSSLSQEYTSRDGKKSAGLAIWAGKMAPQVQNYQNMASMNMNMETGDQIIKTVKVAGQKGMLNLDKKDKIGTLTIILENNMVVTLNLDPATRETDLTGLAQQLPLSRFAHSTR